MSRRNGSVCTKMPGTLKMIERRRGLRCDWMLDCRVLIRKKKGGGDGWVGGGCEELQGVAVGGRVLFG